MKKNNKGFSLVELIVVVLIMAIIAVALAPQVMKWVENSRKSTDCNNYDSIVSAANLAISNQSVFQKLDADVKIECTGTGVAWTCTGGTNAGGAVDAEIKNILGTSWKSDLKAKASQPATVNGANSNKYLITIKQNGTVERSAAPASDTIS